MAKIYNVIIFSILISSINSSDPKKCKQINLCLCEFSDNSKIDLSEVLPKSSTEEFLRYDLNQTSYLFYGCVDGEFSFNKTEPKIIGSLISTNLTNSTQTELLGRRAQINVNPIPAENKEYDDCELVYRNGTKVAATVRLLCSDLEKPFIKILEPGSNILLLSSPQACVQVHKAGISTGSVLVIIFLVLVAVYFLGGAAVLYFMRGARGVELIPNIDFWRSLPGLLRDGIIFIFSGCNANAISTPETYDRI